MCEAGVWCARASHSATSHALQFLFGWLKFRKRERDGEVVYKFHSQMGPIVYVVELLFVGFRGAAAVVLTHIIICRYVVALLAIVFGCTAAFWEPAKGLAILILVKGHTQGWGQLEVCVVH